MKEQAFYGIGPVTSRGDITKYSQKQFDISAGYNNPLTSWSSVGANADFIRPRIVDPNSGIPIETKFTMIFAPGLTTNDKFFRFEPYLQIKIPPRRSMSVASRAGYSFYHAFGDPRFYRHTVWRFVGLVTFYDVGKVGLKPSDLTLGRLRHDIGLGLYVSIANHELARFFIAFGTGEPARAHPKFGGVL